MMDDRVIEAAAKAARDEMERIGGGWSARKIAEAAITAALRELAPDIRAAVERFALAMKGFGSLETLHYYGMNEVSSDAVDDERDQAHAARRDLFALLNIED